MFRIGFMSLYAKKPTRGSAGAAGYDLYAAENQIVPAHGQRMVDTGVVFQFPSDCYARVAPRSGLAVNHRLDVLAGVVDSDFKSSVKVVLINHSDQPFHVNIGDRIAQIIFEKIYTPDLEVVSLEQLEKTERGLKGFGSTGV
jgi:dUTP pyrophosphatase